MPRVTPLDRRSASILFPLYPSVPEAAERNPALGELLALALLEERLQP